MMLILSKLLQGIYIAISKVNSTFEFEIFRTNMEEVKYNSTSSLLTDDDDYTLSSGNSSEIETDDSMIYNVDLENSTEVLPLNDSILYSDIEEPAEFMGSRDFYITVYTVFIIAAMTLTPARSWLFYKIFMNASKGLHKKMFSNVLRAPMRFFDTNPSGN